MAKRLPKEERQERLRRLVEEDPFLTDEELARTFGVSIQTIRLDRMALGLPEMRERARALAERARALLRSISLDEMSGELLHLELGRFGLSVLETTPGMGFARTGIVRGHHIFAQANSLAVAVVDAETALTGTAHLRFLAPVRVGHRIVARATVQATRQNKHLIRVVSQVGGRPVFRGTFIVAAVGAAAQRAGEGKIERRAGMEGRRRRQGL